MKANIFISCADSSTKFCIGLIPKKTNNTNNKVQPITEENAVKKALFFESLLCGGNERKLFPYHALEILIENQRKHTIYYIHHTLQQKCNG